MELELRIAATPAAPDGFEYCAVVCRSALPWSEMVREVCKRLPGPSTWSGVYWNAAFLAPDDFLASVGVPVVPTVAELVAELVAEPVEVYVLRRPGADL